MGDDEVNQLRARLEELGVRRQVAERERAVVMEETIPLVRRGRALGIGPTELQRLTGLSRRAVYDLLEEDGD